MICNRCGYQNSSGAKYCSNCGRKLVQENKPSRKALVIGAVCLLLIGIAIGMLISKGGAFGGDVNAKGYTNDKSTGGPAQKKTVEIAQVLPMSDGSVAALYTDGTVRVSGNAIPAEAVKDWADVAQIYYNEKADWENGAFRYTHCLMALTEDGSVLSTTGDFSGWSNIKELILNWAGVVGVTNDGRVLAQGDWEDPSFLTSLTNVEALVPSSIQSAWGCVKKDGTVIFTDEYGYANPNEVCWTNVKELWDTGHTFYVVKNDGSVESNMLGVCTGLKDAVKTTSFRDWVFGISADGRLLTHDNGSIYPNMGCMMVNAPGLDYYGGEVDIRDFDQVKDIVIFDGMTLLNEDGTVYHIPCEVEWDLRGWDHIEKVYGATDADWNDMMFYGIKQDGSVIRNYYYREQQTQTTTDQYLGWKLQELYTGKGGVVGLTTDGKLVGDGIYKNVDFSVFNS